MPLTLTTAPTLEPISLDEAKVQCRRGQVTDEDALIDSLIGAAREWIEAVTNRALLDQVWTLTLEDFPPDDVIVLPRPPLLSVTSVQYVDTAGATQTWASSNYQVQKPGGPYAERGRIQPKFTLIPPVVQPDTLDAVIVLFRAGYGTSVESVPRPIRQALGMLVAHLYENRSAVELGAGLGFQEMPFGVKALLGPYMNRATC